MKILLKLFIKKEGLSIITKPYQLNSHEIIA